MINLISNARRTGPRGVQKNTLRHCFIVHTGAELGGAATASFSVVLVVSVALVDSVAAVSFLAVLLLLFVIWKHFPERLGSWHTFPLLLTFYFRRDFYPRVRGGPWYILNLLWIIISPKCQSIAWLIIYLNISPNVIIFWFVIAIFYFLSCSTVFCEHKLWS